MTSYIDYINHGTKKASLELPLLRNYGEEEGNDLLSTYHMLGFMKYFTHTISAWSWQTWLLPIDSRVIAWADALTSAENSFFPYLVVDFHILYIVCICMYMHVCV